MAVSILLLTLCICAATLKKAYHHLGISPHPMDVPSRELRLLIKHIAFISLFLELVLLSGLAMLVINIAFTFEVIWAFLTIIATLIAIIIVLPNIKISPLTLRFAESMAKPLSYPVAKLESLITKLEKLIAKTNRKFHAPEPLSKEALLDMLKEQKDIAGSDIKADLELAMAALDINKQKIAYLMVRKQKTKLVNSEEPVGPILLSELHDTGRKIFAAKDKEGDIAGVIRLADLTELKSGGKAKKVMSRQVVRVEKNASLLEAVDKFIEHGCELMVVEDEAKTAGVIYLEDVLKTLRPESTA